MFCSIYYQQNLVVVMASGIGMEVSGSTPDTAKDPKSACGVRVRKIRGFESLVASRQQFIMGVVSGESFPPLCQTHIKTVQTEGATIYRRRQKSVSYYCKRGLACQEQRTPLP